MRKPVWTFSDERFTVTAFQLKGGGEEIELRDHQNNLTAELSERNARFLNRRLWEMSGLTRMVALQHRHDFEPALTPEKRPGEQRPAPSKKQGEDIDRQQSAPPAGMKNEDNDRKR
jgi:hypothetical protein